jgi:transposase
MKYIEGTPREQLCLFEEKLDDIISEDHLVRFIDAYVDKLDLVKLGVKIKDKAKGVGYPPTLYLKIYIYSYLNSIRSSRKIERECKRNLELIWLTMQLSPDHWSISNFRKCNKNLLKNIFKEFLLFCKSLELLSFDCVAIDGTKMRAQNSMSNIYKRNGIDKLLEKIDTKISEYISDLESNDKKEQDEYDFLNNNIPKKLKQLKKNKDKVEVIKKIFEENPELERYFANDPESNFQKDNGRCVVGYNSQTAVDGKNKLIVATDVTNQNNDKKQLNNMKGKVEETKNELNINNKSIGVLDSGYYSESEILDALEDENMDIYIPHPKDVKTKEKQGRAKENKIPSKDFEKENFIYKKDQNIYVCPNGKELTQRGNFRIKDGIKKIKYQCSDCIGCKDYNLCTTSKDGRSLEISENHEQMEKFREKTRTKLGKKIIQKRKELVEHPYGTIKRNLGFTYFMQTGIENVKAEFSFIAFIYNFKRVVNIIGVKGLIEAVL